MAEAQSSSCASSATQKSSKKNVPPLVSEVLDLAIYSFGCQSGLRGNHKIRGDPVVEGVAAFFGRLLSCSSTETKEEFYSFSPVRLGNWEPQKELTEELRTLISSRLKTAKCKGVIRDKQPVVPSSVHEKEETFCEEEDRVKAKFFSKCWRCSRRCSFCIAKKKHFPKFGNFNTDIALPFLDVVEGILEEEEQAYESDPDSEEQTFSEGDGDDDDDDNDELLQRCLSETDLPESEDDEIKEDGEEKADDQEDNEDEDDDEEEEMDEDPFYGDGYY